MNGPDVRNKGARNGQVAVRWRSDQAASTTTVTVTAIRLVLVELDVDVCCSSTKTETVKKKLLFLLPSLLSLPIFVKLHYTLPSNSTTGTVLST